MKNAVVSFTLLAAAWGVQNVALAQQPGSVDYNRVFLPAHGAGDTRRLPDPKTRWGAAALSHINSWSGFVVGYPSEEMATEAAIEMCTRRGGENCLPDYTFRNSCSAVAVGGQYSAYATTPDLRNARRRALQTCSEGGAPCRILWEGCSLRAR